MGTAIAGHAVAGLSFTPEQLEQRRRTLGASEIGAVAGLSSKRTPLDVWAEKLGIVPPFAGNEFTEWGLRFEGAIRQKYIEVTGNEVAVVPPNMVGREEWMSASPDGLIAGQLGLEIKRFGEYRTDDFGPAGTDMVPMEVAAQAHWGMIVTEVDRWDCAVLLGQADFRIYHLRFDEDVADHLRGIGYRFWHEHVIPRVQPPIDGSTASHKYLAQVFKSHSQLLLSPTAEQEKWVALLRQVKAEVKKLEGEESELEARLKLAIGDAAGLEGLCTWKAPRSGPIRWKDVAASLATLLAQTSPEYAEAGALAVPGIVKRLLDGIVPLHTSEPTRRFTLIGKDD